jgi:RNA polymerase sigma factor (TIGR02999 family)
VLEPDTARPPASPLAALSPPAPIASTGSREPAEPAPARGAVTELLVACRAGGRDAYERLFPLVYEHLRAVARAQLRRERGGHTLSTTALVHEAWFKLADPAQLEVRDRAHFLAVASRAMRQVLVEHARRFRAHKRGAGAVHVALDDAERARGEIALEERADVLVALDEALARLAAFSPRLAQVVECRFFGGLTEEETAAALEITARTVRRDWVKARAWLQVELEDAG